MHVRLFADVCIVKTYAYNFAFYGHIHQSLQTVN